jgi:hypothetical protein
VAAIGRQHRGRLDLQGNEPAQKGVVDLPA